MSHLHSLDGKILIALGKPEDKKETSREGVRIFSYLNRKEQEEMINRSRLVITRPGYTTLMELAVLGKKALFIPTPGQTEQMYLAEYHFKKANFYRVFQNEVNLAKDVIKAEKYPGLTIETKPEEAEEKFMEIVFGR